MDSHKLALKFFLADPAAIHSGGAVRVFQSWIQQQAVPGHLLIDVADYDHVPDGPGTVLVAHEANLAIDRAGGRPGLLYVRKQPLEGEGTFAGRLRTVFRATLAACQQLEDDARFAGRVTFNTDKLVFRVNDRLLAPNTAATFADVESDLEAVLTDLYGGSPIELAHHAAPGALFEVRAKIAHATPVADLLHRVGPATPLPA